MDIIKNPKINPIQPVKTLNQVSLGKSLYLKAKKFKIKKRTKKKDL